MKAGKVPGTDRVLVVDRTKEMRSCERLPCEVSCKGIKGSRFLFGYESSAVPQAMTQTPTRQGPVIDLTGLPESAVAAVRTLVEVLRQQVGTPQPALASPDDWQRQFDAYMREVAARAGGYLEGFVLKDSRETVHEGRGE